MGCSSRKWPSPAGSEALHTHFRSSRVLDDIAWVDRGVHAVEDKTKELQRLRSSWLPKSYEKSTDRQTDKEGPIMCSLLMLQCEEQLYITTWSTDKYYKMKQKLKLSRYTPWWQLGDRRYSSYSLITSALDGGEGSASRPSHALAPGKGPPVPIVQEARWAPEPVWTQRLQEISFVLSGDRTSITRSSSP
jgi:hypothetical protein